MRITHQGLYNTALERLTSGLSEFGRAQDAMSTGKRIQRASDDPVGMGRALELRALKRTREQEARNAADGQAWIRMADTKLQGVVDRLQRARELAVRSAGFSDSFERSATAAEIAQIRDDIVALANSRHQGRGLFAGYAAGDAVANVAGTWTYQGDAGKVERRISDDEVVQVNLTADRVFGLGGDDVFTVLDDLEAALVADDTTGIEASISRIDTGMGRVLDGLATLGGAANRIEAAEARISADLVSIRTHLSEVEDVDLAEAIMELQMRESAYQASLAAFARATQPSLIDFLR